MSEGRARVVLDPVARERAALEELVRDLPGYTPEWSPQEHGAGYAVLQSFARLLALFDEKIERLSDRGVLAGLDMLGRHLLAAQAARVPLIFAMQPDSPIDVTLPAGSQVAAKPPATLDPAATASGDAIVFSTERAVTLTPARLAVLYSVDPGEDRYADHSTHLTDGFQLFDAMQLTLHHLYLGHDTLFNLGGHISLLISFVLDQVASQPMQLVWEYFTDADWIPLPFNLEDDTTGGLTASGQLTLRHECGPNAKKTTIRGVESYWLRARLATPLIREGLTPLPRINDLRVRAQFGKTELKPDAAFADGQALDTSKDFYPFGLIPTVASTFYLACKDAFSRPGAMVKIEFTLSSTGTVQPSADGFALKWEYITDDGWTELPLLKNTPPFNFERSPQAVSFACPADWAEREVNGVKQRWMRTRIETGDYGQPPRVTNIQNKQPEFADGNLHAPRVQKALISFEYLTDPEALDHCVIYNDFVYQDVTDAARWPDQSFVPYVPVSDTAAAVHLGFDRALPNGLVNLFVNVSEDGASALPASPFVWEYRAVDGWRELSVLDETHGFRQRGMIQFVGPPQAVAAEGLGDKPLYRLRARLKQGETNSAASCSGIWLNAAWASERRRIERELAGRSDGNPQQSFQLRRAPVLAGETVEVEEWVGKGEGWRNAFPEVAERDIRFERDPVTNAPIAAWVRWCERPHFFSSGPADRHYVLERATGVLRFGAHVPIAGRRISMSYTSGGGISGNVGPDAAKELRTAVPYLIGASNPIAAAGGAERESEPGILARGPQRLRHRDRGIAALDLEWLALEASPEVARVRCVPVQGPNGRAERGWITLLVVPYSRDALPVLSSELARTVRDHVSSRLPATARVRVVGPQYSAVSLRAVIVPSDPTLAAPVEGRVRTALDRFLHPLLGGSDARGWRFGEPVHLSQLASLIESVDGVEHAEDILPLVDGVVAGMVLEIRHDRLVCQGPHELVMRLEVR
jgi:hypothetical protein